MHVQFWTKQFNPPLSSYDLVTPFLAASHMKQEEELWKKNEEKERRE